MKKESKYDGDINLLIVRLLGLLTLKEFETKVDQVEFLDGRGFEIKDIALLINSSEDNVRTMKKRIDGKKKGGKKNEKQRKTK